MKVCSVEGCESAGTRRGWCNAHYKRWQKYGDPLGVATRPTRTVYRGYVRIKAPGHPEAGVNNWALEHRVVAHDTFGPIPEGFHVHHRNHDKQDNRPENLQVLASKAHAVEHGLERRSFDRAEAVHLYVDEGLTTVEIADRFNTESSAVYRALAKAGVEFRSPTDYRVEIDPDTLRRLHAEPGARVRSIARRLGVGEQIVRDRMKELGLPSFPPGRPRVGALRRRAA